MNQQQPNNNHVSRYEFDAAMKRIEALLDTQTKILIQLASAETDNKHRDSRIDDAVSRADRALQFASDLRLTSAKAAGAASVLIVVAQLLAKKLGIL